VHETCYTCGCGSVIIWLRYIALCTSGFMDDVIFTHILQAKAMQAAGRLLKRVGGVIVTYFSRMFCLKFQSVIVLDEPDMEICLHAFYYILI